VTSFKRTSDLALVRHILTEPEAYASSGDDYVQERSWFRVNEDPRIWYVLPVFDEALVLGLIMFLPRSCVLWEVHLVLLRVRHRPRGRFILAGALRWMFEESSALRIIAEVPACNRLAVRLASQVMTGFGVNPHAFMKGGVMQDLVQFGVDKGELCPVL